MSLNQQSTNQTRYEYLYHKIQICRKKNTYFISFSSKLDFDDVDLWVIALAPAAVHACRLSGS